MFLKNRSTLAWYSSDEVFQNSMLTRKPTTEARMLAKTTVEKAHFPPKSGSQ